MTDLDEKLRKRMSRVVPLVGDSPAKLVASLGPCCRCRGPQARRIVKLELRAPIPETGWGCKKCGHHGAIAVMCDRCAKKKPKYAVKGYTENSTAADRVPIKDLTEAWGHDPKNHEEE